MIFALSALLVFQLAGEVLARSLSLPIPGPVIGMLMLFVALVLRGGPGEELQTVSDEWLPLLVSLLVSTLATLVVTALVMKLCQRSPAPSKEAP